MKRYDVFVILIQKFSIPVDANDPIEAQSKVMDHFEQETPKEIRMEFEVHEGFER